MKIAFVVEGPTQFEAPFFRFAAADPQHRLEVLFTRERPGEAQVDPELGRPVSWGMDLVGGYQHAEPPASGARGWLPARLAGGGYDLVIVNGYTRWEYLRAARAAKRTGALTGLRLDSVAWSGRRRGKALLFRAVLGRLFDLYFAVGSLTREYLQAVGVRDERIALFPYAVDVDHFRRGAALGARDRAALRRDLDLPVEAPVVLSVAKLSSREAPWDLLRALALLGDQAPWTAVAGDGPSRGELEAFAREKGLTRLRFLGYVPYPELPALYGASDLFVHPVREERWGVSVAEALAADLPVVASSRVGAAHDLVEAGANGFTYPAGDPRALARCLRRTLDELVPGEVARRNREILTHWDYAAAWRGILRAAAQCLEGGEQRP